ncbi:MAG: hypothetical protein HRU38_03570 [Saccharospirillaceae bacterium]|nr:hypothetical protein [Pseudomonadales bacterium]NRB77742.1 hypothetical protein [Saccharospirillaceae bacterium]
MKLINNTSLHNVIKNTTALPNKVGFMSVLLLSAFVFSSCEDSLTDNTLTDHTETSSPAAVEINRVSATVNQNNITVIAKSMIQTLNQINPALSNDIYSVGTIEKSGAMNNCAYSGLQFSETLKYDALTFVYDLEFLDCQKSADNDRLLGELSADVIYSTTDNKHNYSLDLNSRLKQTNRYGQMTVSHVNSFIQVNGNTSTQSFTAQILLDGHGTFFVKSVSLLKQDNQTQQWISGHLILSSIQQDIDVYIERDEGLYFEFADGSMQVITWDELSSL